MIYKYGHHELLLIKDQDGVKIKSKNFRHGIENTLRDVGQDGEFDTIEKRPIEESVASCGGVERKEGYAQQLDLAEKISWHNMPSSGWLRRSFQLQRRNAGTSTSTRRISSGQSLTTG